LPNIEIKTVDRLGTDDRLLVDFGNLHKAGRLIDPKLIQMLGRLQVPHVPTISLTYEEKKKYPTEEEQRNFIDSYLENRITPWEKLRLELFEVLQEIYQPFDETDAMFNPKGRAKMLSSGRLFQLSVDPAANAEIQSAGNYFFSAPRLARLTRIFQDLLDCWKSFYPNLPDYTGKLVFPRLNAFSIRAQSQVAHQRLEKPGSALAWHATDTAYLYLASLCHFNKTRFAKGYPLSTTKYDVNFNYGEGMFFSYPEEYLVNAAVGAALHAFGFCHREILKAIAPRPILQPKLNTGLITQLRGALNLLRHLIKPLNELSPLTRMVILGQGEYPDGSGWPPTKHGRMVHPFVRLFHIVEFYDTWTNPYYQKLVFSREDVLAYLWNHSEYFENIGSTFPAPTPFDRSLLEEFLAIIAPWEVGEKVYLFPWEDINAPHFVGRVLQYQRTYVPLISILRDELNGKNYPFGRYIFDISRCRAYVVQDKQIVQKMEYSWIGQLRLHDTTTNPADMSKFSHPYLGEKRLVGGPKESKLDQNWDEEDEESYSE